MKENYLLNLIKKHKNNGLLIDSNLLLLLFIGSFSVDWIQKYKRTKQYVIEDYQVMVSFIKHFNKILTTPNILTEVSNLSNQLPEKVKNEYFPVFAKKVTVLQESYHQSIAVCQSSNFRRFGLTDTLIIDIGNTGCLVLTDDFRLAGYLESMSISVINFNHLRGWLIA
ncbi:hypothetical protein SAMN05660649_05127 [Desulfotomaculum arcticum]|uniref:PIN domain-containing protein n=1 Tax=Desulfotruncus arcticus DSM 17038 TaxID=1121424 RepID=A0A1I2ZUT4_9FIRM|nr:PIN domain-containing protein [Desulfotruncus arcticus]SFH41627.1 hypothetical protein SAMN05660649_05127 [Desulfotomaculum arcticum] [Desulfotruncus arcticus DSM 17038]